MPKVRPIYPIVIDDPDQPRPFRWDSNAYAAFEAAIGRSIGEMDGSYFGFLEVRALVYSGLLHVNRKITLNQAGELMDEIPDDDRQETFNAIVKAFYKSLGVDVDAQGPTEEEDSKNSSSPPETATPPESDSAGSDSTDSGTKQA